MAIWLQHLIWYVSQPVFRSNGIATTFSVQTLIGSLARLAGTFARHFHYNCGLRSESA